MPPMFASHYPVHMIGGSNIPPILGHPQHFHDIGGHLIHGGVGNLPHPSGAAVQPPQTVEVRDTVDNVKEAKEPPPHIIAWFDELEKSGRGRYMKLREKYATTLISKGYPTLDTFKTLTVDYLTSKIEMKDGEAESLIRWAKHDLDTKYCEVD